MSRYVSLTSYDLSPWTFVLSFVFVFVGYLILDTLDSLIKIRILMPDRLYPGAWLDT